MKKLLFSISIIPNLMFGQVFLTENFNAFSLSNLSNDITGATPGQNNWFVSATNSSTPSTSTNASATSAMIVSNTATMGNVLQLTGPNGSSGNVAAWKGNINTLWETRTAGNNVLQCEYDLFTGPATSSLNTMRLVFFDASSTRIMGGLIFAANTKSIKALGYYNNAGALGNYSFNLGTGGSEIILPQNTWVRIGFSFNKTTGRYSFKGPGFDGYIDGAAIGLDPNRAILIGASGTLTSPTTVNNTSSFLGLYDNIVIRAVAASDLLATQDLNMNIYTKSSVYPNPTKNEFRVNLSEEFNKPKTKIQLFNLSGQLVKEFKTSDSYNVSELAKGTYVLVISDGAIQESKKIIKE